MILWLRIRLPMQETGSIPGPGRFHEPRANQACAPPLLKSVFPRAVLHSKRSHHDERRTCCNWKAPGSRKY